MIINDRQYKITKEQAQKLQAAIDSFDPTLEKKNIDARLLKAEKDALLSQIDSLKEEMREYEELVAGTESISELCELADLPKLLIKARISQGLSQTDLAHKLAMKPQQIQRYESEEYASANIARLLEVANSLGITVAKSASIALHRNEMQEPWKNYPIKEMYQKGWFTGFDGTYKQLLANIDEWLADFFSSSEGNYSLALHKKKARAGSKIDMYALHAWQTRVVQKALDVQSKVSFKPSHLNEEWIRKLVALSSNNDGPALVPKYLEAAGINFVIEPHLNGTHLDGAALRIPAGNPVVAMTLRHDRLDNFWFVLLHEIGHISKHFNLDMALEFFDDLDEENGDEKEREANQFAYEALIPSQQWATSFARYIATHETVTEQAKAWGISPAIIAGRIRKEQQNWRILNDQIGSGEVRALFPEISFAW